MSIREIVVSATERLFNQKDLTVVDESFGPVYVQHSALGPDGVDGLKGLVSQLPETSSYELVRVLVDGEMVVTEGIFTGFAPIPLTGYDVWRVVGNRIVEHWDALGATATHPSDAAVTGAATSPIVKPEVTAANRAIVSEWVEKALVGGDDSVSSSLLSPQHVVDYDHTLVYKAIHAVIAEGDLVYIRAEGESNGPVIVNDVWRVEDGLIAEHWGLVTPVPANLPHSNGAF